MTTKHTPGPWREVVNCADYEAFPTLIYAGSSFVAQVATDQLTVESRDEANARLIAAAPDLLTTIEGLLAHCAGTNAAFYGSGKSKDLRAAFTGQKELMQAARAAIAKAKGTQ